MSYLSKFLDEHTSALMKYKGLLLFIEGKVSFSSASKDFAEFNVTENWEYTVDLSFNEDRQPVKVTCDCSKYSSVLCKHSVGSLYYLNSHKFFSEGGPGLDDIYAEAGEEQKILSGKNKMETPFIDTQTLDPEYSKILEVMKHYDKPQKQATPKIIDKLAKTRVPAPKPEEVKFNEARIKLDGLVHPGKVKKIQKNIRFAYLIQNQYDATTLFPLRLRIRKDGSIGDYSFVYSADLSEFEDLSFEDKIILDYLLKNGGQLRVEMYDFGGRGERYKRIKNSSVVFSELLEKYLVGNEIYVAENNHNPLENPAVIEPVPLRAVIKIDEDSQNINLILNVRLGKNQLKNLKDFEPLLPEPLWIWNKKEIYKFDNLTKSQFDFFSDNNFIYSFPKLLREYFEKDILSELLKSIEIESDRYNVEKISGTPGKLIYLEESAGKLILRLKFRYGGYIIDFGNGKEVDGLFTMGNLVQVLHDNVAEDLARKEIKDCFVKEIEPGVFNPRNDPVTFLFTYLDVIREKGFEIFGESELSKFKITQHTPRLSVAISSGMDWFDVAAEVQVGDSQVTLTTLFESIKQKKSFIRLSDGSNAKLTKEWLDKFERIFSFAELKENGIRFSNTQAPIVEQLIAEVDEAVVDTGYREHLSRLKEFTSIIKTPIPEEIEPMLRPYQKLGFDWFYFLKEFKFGGILADDMGLGKTIQVLALLLNEKKRGATLPTLIVAPTSVVFNWINESQKFTPGLKILEHTGVSRIKESTLHFEEYDCIITSYGVLLRDEDIFIKRDFHYIILDESQRIKNPLAKTSRMVRRLHANHRLCLTGTPVENNLTELWSQFTFLNYGMFSSLTVFKESLVKPIQRDHSADAAVYLKKIIYPFILRRTKDLVAKELPPKTEIIHYCEMDEEQLKLYDIWKNSIRNEVMSQIDSQGLRKSRFKIIEGLLRLRQICNHPMLLKNATVKKSGKFEEFKELIQKVIEEDHKVLVFSQFVKMLDIIEIYLKRHNLKYEILTGKSINREQIVDRFQNDEKIKIFLISLKAGGFGLNLTAADYVFHYDPWWNPAVEMQATDRTHRIGQEKNVFVYKFITKNSVEEKILQLQEQKRELVGNIVSTDTGIFKSLNRNDIEILFS